MLQNIIALVAFAQWGFHLGPFGEIGTTTA
jgi:hypothetical protein